MKRAFDFLAAGLALVLLSPLYLATALLVRLTSPGPVLYKSMRVGQWNRLFSMYKFRTMRLDTPQVATHLMADPQLFLTPVGQFLRRSSLDELPQLLNVLKGEMSLVGPRPALFNQDDLVAARTDRGVEALLPGITGWAQVNGRDELPIPVKVEYDAEYLRRLSWLFDLWILLLTAKKVITGTGVSH